MIVLEFKIYVYNFADLKQLHQIETLAICALSSGPASCVLACPRQHSDRRPGFCRRSATTAISWPQLVARALSMALS